MKWDLRMAVAGWEAVVTSLVERILKGFTVMSWRRLKVFYGKGFIRTERVRGISLDGNVNGNDDWLQFR